MSELNITVGIKPKTIYRLEARRRGADGNIISRRTSSDIPNVFMDHGVEVLFGRGASSTFGPQNLNYAVGTGSSEPSITAPSMDNFVAGASNVGSSDSLNFIEDVGPPRIGIIEFRQNALFPIGASGGNVNITEVGAAFEPITGPLTPLCSRALVVDSEGAPTAFEWLEDEELLLTAFHRRYISLEDVVITGVPISGDGPDQTVTIRPCRLGSMIAWGWPGDFSSQQRVIMYYGEDYTLPDPLTNSTGTSSGSGAGNQNSVNVGMSAGSDPYVPGSKKRTRWGEMETGSNRNIVGASFGSSASGNATRSRAFGEWAVKFDPGIPKTSLHRIRIGMTFKIDNTP